jgi:Glu-tRNA(Gln) amidotransferase subunit E-like FAD-binding protein
MSVVGVFHSEELPAYELPGNRLRGLATRSRGSSEVALWTTLWNREPSRLRTGTTTIR